MKRVRLFFPYVFSALAVAFLLFLGTWQVQRLAWKENLMAQVAARADQPAKTVQALPPLAALSAQSHDYMAVQLSGRWLYERQHYWFAQIMTPPNGFPHADRIGFHVITPLLLADGQVVMVDRGFIPNRLKDQPARYNNAPQTFIGRLRWPSPRGRFDNPDQPQQGLWYVRDPQAMAQSVGLQTFPFLIDQVTPVDRWPLAGQTRMVFANRHLEYAVTWFSLAAILVIILIVWHIHSRRTPRTER